MIAKKNQNGFTIIELLTSTVVFSLILLAAMAGLVQIGRLYYKGITTARTQEATRNVMSEISQSIQFSRQPITTTGMAANPGPEVPGADGEGFFCVGPRRFSYTLDRKLVTSTTPSAKETRHALWVDTPILGCAQDTMASVADLSIIDPCGAGGCSDGRELLGENMRISRLQLTPAGATWTIDIGIAYGDDDTQDGGPLRLSEDMLRRNCIGGTFSVQFCAISELRSTVTRRL